MTNREELPLAGVKVLDFMWVMAGPAISRSLADYGATVIKVESSTHVETGRTLQPFWQGVPDPERSGFEADVNAGKLGLSLNCATEAGRTLALKLVQWADVVCESFTPKVMEAWGLDYAALRRVKPDIIMLSTSLNGLTGPWSQFAGFGNLGAALAGFASFVQWPDRAPSGPFSAYTDYVAPKFGLVALLAALDHRRRTGQGQQIDIAQSEAALHFLSPQLLDYTANGRTSPPAGNSDPVACPHGVYPATGDDRWVAIACENEAQWQALRAAIGAAASPPDFATLLGRKQHEDALNDVIAAWTAARPADESERILHAAGVPVSVVQTIESVFAEPQLNHRNHFVQVPHALLGTAYVENSRAKMSVTPARITHAGPALGQHTETVLRDILGMSEDEIIEAAAAGAIE